MTRSCWTAESGGLGRVHAVKQPRPPTIDDAAARFSRRRRHSLFGPDAASAQLRVLWLVRRDRCRRDP
ncbi:hypothetical protein ACFOLD_12655 [Kocuria carniphila]|uniref:hypothetical protein n=1 Tax=Kocuria carniphila TaxID=262208 RepID=UPI003621301E